MLAPLDRVHVHRLADLALQAQHDLLGRLGLFVEDGLGLATEPGLLAVVAPLALRVERGLARLVLGDLVHLVLAAGLALAEGALGLGDVDLRSFFVCRVGKREGESWVSGTKRKEVDSDRPPVGDDGRQRRKQSGNQSWPRAMMITRRPPEKTRRQCAADWRAKEAAQARQRAQLGPLIEDELFARRPPPAAASAG